MSSRLRLITQPFGSRTSPAPSADPNASNSRRRTSRPSPMLRTHSEAQPLSRPGSSHFSLPSPAASPPSPLRLKSSDRLTDALVQRSEERRFSGSGGGAAATSTGESFSADGRAAITTPPATPTRLETADPDDADMSHVSPLESCAERVTEYDFAKLDYELSRAKVLGTGLWSTVYLAEPASCPVLPTQQQQQQQQSRTTAAATATTTTTPPLTPSKPRPSLLAIKVPSRRDATPILTHEAQILTRLQRNANSAANLVPFLGQDARTGSLVFEAIIGGSLEALTRRLAVMTEQSRHRELVAIFPKLAEDLVSGLQFLHASGVVHADVKTANVLLHVEDHYSWPVPLLRARYIDFSASFVAGEGAGVGNAGGTWEFMAPEQMRVLDKELSRPSFASDVWSLGITLLAVVIGGSPYAAACGENVFMLREAVKGGDPLGFARRDPVCALRMSVAQEFVDCCRLALQKERGRRVTAEGWGDWVRERRAEVWALF
ncbi:hypothetical protein MBLNU230_g3863t1 [Neophaeotheca triangularis]